MKIDINKKYRYRNGDAARIICTDAPGIFPVIAIDDKGGPTTHTESGLLINGGISQHDLIEVREPREWTLRGHSLGFSVGVIHNGPGISADESPIRVREIID